MTEQVRQTVFTCHSPENKDESTYTYSVTPVVLVVLVALYQQLLNACLTSERISCVWFTCCVFEL